MENLSSAQRPSSRRSTHRANQGFTLIELLIAIAIGTLLVGMALFLVLNTRKPYTTDVARTSVDDNLRAGLDMINADVRQAGERLPQDLAALQILKGSGGASDTLVVRRNLIDNVLPLCQTVVAGSTGDLQVTTQSGTSTNTNCNASTTDLTAWYTYRSAQGGVVRAYLYDPSVRKGEFFDYSSENLSLGTLHRRTGTWSLNYSAAAQPRLYLLEERKYTLDSASGDLTVTIGNALPALHVISGITNFTVATYLKGSTGTYTPVLTDFGVNSTDNWMNLAYLDVALTGSQKQGSATVSRTLNDQPVPRNVLSR